MKLAHLVGRQVAGQPPRERCKQQSRRRYAANGFAFVPPNVPPDTLGLSDRQRQEQYTPKRAVSDKTNVCVCRGFFTAAKRRTVNVRARGADKKSSARFVPPSRSHQMQWEKVKPERGCQCHASSDGEGQNPNSLFHGVTLFLVVS